MRKRTKGFIGVGAAILLIAALVLSLAENHVLVGWRIEKCTFGGGSMSPDTMAVVHLDSDVDWVGLNETQTLAAVTRRNNGGGFDYYFAGRLIRRSDRTDLGVGVWFSDSALSEQRVGAVNSVARRWSRLDAQVDVDDRLVEAAEKCLVSNKGK